MKRQGSYKHSRELNYGGRWVRSFALVLGLNLIMFALQHLIQIQDKDALSKDLTHYLGLNSEQVLVNGWAWQLVTHIFLHDLLPLVLNVLLFWLIAADLEARWGPAKVLAAYAFCGLGGGFLACCTTALSASGPARIYGSAGSVLGMLGIYGMLFPERYFFSMVRARWFFWTLVCFHAFWYLVADRERMVALAQMTGGVGFGYLFLWAEPRVARRLHRWNRTRRLRARREMFRIRQKVDALLDRIHREGIDNLSRRERAFLRMASKRYQEELVEHPAPRREGASPAR